MTELFRRLSAQFVSFEGIDGCGKSTLLDSLAGWLEKDSIPFVKTREPGGTRLGEEIRELLLDSSFAPMNEQAEVLLYTASRAQLVQEVIQPALAQGMWVLADRFIDATLAYQGFGRGLELGPLRQIQEWAAGGLWPDFTILLDCDVDVASARMKARPGTEDRIEQESRGFHERVRNGYMEIARLAPQRFVVLDAGRGVAEVIVNFHAALTETLRRRRCSEDAWNGENHLSAKDHAGISRRVGS
jgi:dTMP kinase